MPVRYCMPCSESAASESVSAQLIGSIAEFARLGDTGHGRRAAVLRPIRSARKGRSHDTFIGLGPSQAGNRFTVAVAMTVTA